MAFEKMYMVLAEDLNLVNIFEGRLSEDPTLDTAAKLMSRKMDILKNPKTGQGFKKRAIKQIDPSIELYIKKLRQLSASLSVDADPAKLEKSLKDEEGDLVTPVQQKLLKRILSDVTPKREPVTPRRVPLIPVKRPATQTTVIKKESKNPKTETASTSKDTGTIPWSKLPFTEEGPEPDYEGAVQKTLRRLKKTLRYLKQLRPAKGWTSWDPSGKKKKAARKKSKSSVLGSIANPLGSIAKQLAFDDSST